MNVNRTFGHLEICINFVIQFKECLLGFIIETIHANLNCFTFVTKDRVCAKDVNQTASRDDLFNTTIIEGLTDDIAQSTRR